MIRQRLNQAEEIHTFDFIQGLGLLGMLLMNSQTYSLFAFLSPQQVYALQLDQADSYTPTQFFLHLLVNGPCYGLFSVGLGWGFHRRWHTDQQTGLDAGRMARRRLWALLGLGLVHGLVVWFGDLLHLYALLGFTLLYFVNRSVSTLRRWIAGLIGLVVLIQLTQFLVVPHSPPAPAAPEPSMGGLMSQFVATWQHGSFLDVMRLQSAGGLLGHTRAIEQGLAPYVQLEILLLVGLIVSKLGAVDRPAEVRVQLSLLLVFIFPLAVLLKGVSSLSVVESLRLPARWQAYQPLLFSLGDFLGTTLLTGVYLVEIGLNRRPSPHRVAVWIGQVGRMSLTNYLLQSGLSMFLFYGYGLGLSGQLTLLGSVGVVLVLYGFQLWFSHWWLSRYRQGPVEQLLNRWTYRNTVAKPSAPVKTG